MKVLVTGGAGFIGTNLIKKLLEKGYEVVSIDNYNTGLVENHIEGCEYINDDIVTFKDYDKINPEIIFHLAALARIQPSFKNPIEYFHTNVNGTLNLVKWCDENKVPIIYAGTSSKHSGRFKNPYTFTKDLGEDIITLYQKHYDLNASMARFYNVYGPYQIEDGSYSTVIGIWLKRFREGNQLLVTGDGEQRRDFTHVDDIVNALCLIMETNSWGYDFELGRGVNYSLNEIIKLIGVTPKYIPPRKGEARNTLNTDTTAHTVLGWQPVINLEDYIKSEFK